MDPFLLHSFHFQLFSTCIIITLFLMHYHEILPRSNFTSITTPLTLVYGCSTNSNQLIFGLVLVTEEGVLSAMSAISAIIDDRQSSLLQYNLTAQTNSTQNVLLTIARPVMTPTTNTPDSTDAIIPGLTTVQSIFVAVGIVVAAVLTTIFVVLW